jgi:hypothetical protein
LPGVKRISLDYPSGSDMMPPSDDFGPASGLICGPSGEETLFVHLCSASLDIHAIDISPRSINPAGMITGNYTVSGQWQHGFLLSHADNHPARQ